MICDLCGQERYFDLLEVWADERCFTVETCCEGYHESLVEDLQYAAELKPRERLAFLAPLRELFAGYGIDVRQVYADPEDGTFKLDYGLELQPIELTEAKAFIGTHHRHNKPPVGWRWGHALTNGDELVAVATIGRPTARMIPAAEVVEVTRLCVNPDLCPELAWNACSQLYAAAAKEAKRRGYRKVITYTLESESGHALRAAGWTPEAKTKGGSWNRPGRARKDTAPTTPKIRWARYLCVA